VNYRFGHFILRSDQRELLKDGIQVRMQPKAFDLLLYLLENRDRVVSKEEILDTLWPDIHVSETALTRCIMKARRAVGDDADQQSIIKTVHGHGYRLAAEVTEQEDSDLIVAGSAKSPSAPKSKRLSIAILSSLVLLAGIFASLHLLKSEAAVHSFRVAVLPIENATGDPDLEWTELGLMSLVDNYLTTEAGFKTVSSKEVLKFSDNASRSGEGMDVVDNTAQRLLQAEGATHVIAAALSKQKDVFSIQYSIVRSNDVRSEHSLIGGAPIDLARQLGGSIASSLSEAKVPEIEEVISKDAFVEEAFARGRAQELRGKDESALNLYKAALEQDPENFWVNFHLSIVKRNLGESEEAESRFLKMINALDVREEPKKATRLHLAIGFLYYKIGDSENAKVHFDRSLNYAMLSDDRELIAEAFRHQGIIADYTQDFDLARDYYQRALTEYLAIGVSPPPAGLLNAFAILEAGEGNYSEAARYFEMGLERHRATGSIPSIARAHGNLAFLHYRRGDWEKSSAFFIEALKLSRELEDPNRIAFNLVRFAKLKVDQGQLDEAEKLNQEASGILDEIGNKRLTAFLMKIMASVRHARGQYDAALEYYTRHQTLSEEMGDFGGIQTAALSIARVKFDQGDLTSALAEAETALAAIQAENKGSEAEALELIGEIKLAQGQTMEGIALHEEAQQIAIERRQGLNIARLSARLGEFHLQEQNTARATAYLQEAQAINPELPYVLKLEANLAFVNGDIEAAAELMERAKDGYGDHWSDDDETRLIELSQQTKEPALQSVQ